MNQKLKGSELRQAYRPRVYGDNTWLCAGLSGLLSEVGYVPAVVCDVPTLSAGGRWPLPPAPVPVICVLPRELGALMDTLWVLRRLLTGSPVRHHVILLTSAPAGWVRETMVNLLSYQTVAHGVMVLPEHTTTRTLLRAVNGHAPDGVPDSGESAGLCPLTPSEVFVLSGMLAWCMDVAEIASLREVPEAWVRRVLARAVRKSGARSARRLLAWRPGSTA